MVLNVYNSNNCLSAFHCPTLRAGTISFVGTVEIKSEMVEGRDEL